MDSYRVVKQFARTLRNLDGVLEKAVKHAEARKFDANNFVTARLFPDMRPFAFQIQTACDNAKNAAANLSGKAAPRHEDTETTMAELRARIAKCLAFLDTFTFQAPDFYVKHGYEIYARADDWPVGHAHFFLRKALPSPP